MRITTCLAALGVILTAPLAAAEPDPACDELWFARNQILDRAGYCFSTPLARAVFSRDDCVGEDVPLSAQELALIAELRSVEQLLRCEVDTTRTALAFDDLEIRRRVRDTPILDPEASAGCIGWRGAQTMLRAGRAAHHDVIGRIEPGDIIIFEYVPVEGWQYIRARDERGVVKSAGWLELEDFTTLECDGWAG